MKKLELKAGLRNRIVLVLLTCLTCPVIAIQASSREATVANVQNIARLYMAAFDRIPDRPGFNHWVQAWEAGRSMQDIAEAFYRSPEFARHYAPLSDQQFLQQLFANVLGRHGTPSEIEMWLEAIAGGDSRARVLLNFARSPENIRNTRGTVSGIYYYDYAEQGAVPAVRGEWIFYRGSAQSGMYIDDIAREGGDWVFRSGNATDWDFSAPSEPVQASSLQFAAIAAGYFHNCAITVDGEAYCWGSNKFGQLGSTRRMEKCGVFACSAGPVPVDGGHRFKQVVAGRSHSCGLELSGAAYCWGSGVNGELGDGQRTGSRVPVPVSGGLRFSALAANATSASTCGLTRAGVAWCWGSNRSGVLGAGTDEPLAEVPRQVMTALRFASVSISDRTACGVSTEGDAYCWGNNHYGQLGVTGGILGGLARSNSPIAVPGGEKFIQIQTDGWHSCALQATGAVYCWGIHSQTDLYPLDWSRYSPGYNFLPARVGPADAPWTSSSASPWVLLGVGDGQTCALAADGELDCWGNDLVFPYDWGPVKAEEPVPVGGNRSFITFSSGGLHDCALTAEGTAYCWGSNAWGQLGRTPQSDWY